MRKIGLSRRGFIASPILLLFPSTKAIASPAHRIIWGGLGFNAPATEVTQRFPRIHAGIEYAGGFEIFIEKLVDQLTANYGGEGVAYGKFEKIRTNEVEGKLIFLVGLDYEDLLRVPDLGGHGDILLPFIYAQAQILSITPPDDLGQGGELRILYSFPFRVTTQSLGTMEKSQIFADLLFNGEQSLVGFFSEKVASRSFQEAVLPARMKVTRVDISPEAISKLDELSVAELKDPSFWGRSMSSSLAMEGDISLVPFESNDAFGPEGLASRFDQARKILALADRLDREDQQLDYRIELEVSRLLRKSNGSNKHNTLYARGMSVFVRVYEENSDQPFFDQKILLIENNELPKSMYAELEAFDRRYLIQIAIKLFDQFVRGVMKQDSAVLESIGIKPEQMTEVVKLRSAFQRCAV